MCQRDERYCTMVIFLPRNLNEPTFTNDISHDFSLPWSLWYTSWFCPTFYYNDKTNIVIPVLYPCLATWHQKSKQWSKILLFCAIVSRTSCLHSCCLYHAQHQQQWCFSFLFRFIRVFVGLQQPWCLWFLFRFVLVVVAANTWPIVELDNATGAHICLNEERCR